MEKNSVKEIHDIIYSYLYAAYGTNERLRILGKYGLLRELYKIVAGSSINEEVIKLFSDKCFYFKAEVISEEDLQTLANNFAVVFPILVDPREHSWDEDQEYLQPKEVTDFVVNLAHFPEGVAVYNPFAGLASYAIALPNNFVVGEEIHKTTWAIAQMRMLSLGVCAQIVQGDSFSEMKSSKKYEAIITSPVYSKQKGQRIHEIVASLYEKLTDNGKLVCLVPHSFLDSYESHKLREKLINEKSIEAIITLPQNIFWNPYMVQDVIVIHKGNSEESIIMADTRRSSNSNKLIFDWKHFLKELDEDVVEYHSKEGSIEESRVGVRIGYKDLMGTVLTPSRYLIPKPKNGVMLSTLAEIIIEENCDCIGNEDLYITASSLPEAMHRKPFVPKKVNNGNTTIEKHKVYISGEAVFIAMVNKTIRTVYLENFHGNVFFPKRSIKVLKPVKSVSAKYLAALLSSKIVADQIKEQNSLGDFPLLSNFDLGCVVVPDHSTDSERESLILDVLSSEMSDLERELQETIDKQTREIRSIRHAMIQTLSALSSNWEQLNMFAHKKNGHIQLSDMIGRINPISIEHLMGTISHAISTLGSQVESLRFEKSDWGPTIEINPDKFINDYISKHSTPEVRMVNIGTKNRRSFFFYFEAENNTKDVKSVIKFSDGLTFYAPERIVEHIFNNIVSNARAHGFTRESSSNEIRFDWGFEDGNIVITVANNGNPLKEGVTSDDVLMSGFSTALNENASDGTFHSGQGGFEIKSLMEMLGKIEIISEPYSEFPVTYKLIFTKTNVTNLIESGYDGE